MARSFITASSQYLQNTSYSGISTFPCSLGIWFYPTTTQGQRLLWLKDPNNDGTDSFSMALNTSDYLSSQWRNSAGDAYGAVTTVACNQNAWNLAIATFAAVDDFWIYLNGGNAIQSTDATGTNNAMTRAYIGCSRATALTNFFQGYLAEATVWNVALTAAEVASLWATRMSLRYIRPASAINHWRLMGNSSPEPDLKGGYDMSLGNGPTKAANPPITYPLTQLFTIPFGGAPAQVIGPFPTHL